MMLKMFYCLCLLCLLVVTLTQALTSNPRCYKSINVTGACIPLNESICMGGTFSFKSTSLYFAKDSQSLSDVFTNLQLWSGLRNVPQCWSVIQPFLCAVYLPKCDDVTGVELPSRELCERVRKPCHIVEEVKGWPDFLQCDNPNFESGCKLNTYDKLSFNTSGKCEYPLVRTDDPDSWYQGVEGCGIPCQSPLFTTEQHEEVHTFVAIFGSICLFCTLFTVLTFIIDWKNANRYPALILFFINACFFLGSVGWMAQFAGDARTDIVCRKDGTVRKGEPKLGSNESISCTMVFVIVYYFLVAGVSWFVMLAYAWYLTFVALGTPRDGLTSKTAYFHLISWCSPLVLTIICLAISEVDGDSVSGICFVGSFNHGVRAVFVLVPVGLVIVVGTFFLLRGVYTLIKIRKEAPVFIPEKTFSKIRDTIIRLGVFTSVALIFALITFSVHVYIFANEGKWRKSFREYMYCMANVSVTARSPEDIEECVMEDRPSLVVMEIHIFAFFGAGIAMSSWSWTKSSLSSWERFFRWIFHKPSNKPVRLKRHRMIAQAFEKRKEINQGRVSISYRSSHDDPLGMKFDLNSCSDDDLSSTFAMAMPKLVRRRGGLIYPAAGIGRRYSDSDVQSVISTRRVSRESQFLEFREAQFVVFDRDHLPYDPYGKRSRKKLKKKRGKLNRIKPILGPMFSRQALKANRNMMAGHHTNRRRKESDSSAISQMSAQSVQVPLKHNSIETISLESNNEGPPDTILPAVTKSSHSNSLDQDSTQRSHQFLKEMNKDRSMLMGGVGGANAGMQEVLSLPGAIDDNEEEKGHNDKEALSSTCLPSNDSQVNHSQQQFNKLRGRRQSMAAGLSDKPHQNVPIDNKKINASLLKSKNHCIKTTSSSATTMMQKKTKKLTVESVDLSSIPFSPLMADIGGGNWGVLLGKSGSSSGSEAGGGCGYGYMSGGGGSFFKPITHNITPHYPMAGSAFYPYPSNNQASPNYPNANNYMDYEGGYNHLFNNPCMGSPTDVMGGGGYASAHMGVAKPQMGGAKPCIGGGKHQCMNGARPKVRENLGHFPAHIYYTGIHDRDRAITQTQRSRHQAGANRAPHRSMKVPNNTFFNSTFEVEDDVESISA